MKTRCKVESGSLVQIQLWSQYWILDSPRCFASEFDLPPEGVRGDVSVSGVSHQAAQNLIVLARENAGAESIFAQGGVAPLLALMDGKDAFLQLSAIRTLACMCLHSKPRVRVRTRMRTGAADLHAACVLVTSLRFQNTKCKRQEVNGNDVTDCDVQNVGLDDDMSRGQLRFVMTSQGLLVTHSGWYETCCCALLDPRVSSLQVVLVDRRRRYLRRSQ